MKVSISCSVISDSVRLHGLYSLSDSSVHGISQARILEWITIFSSRKSSNPEIEPGTAALLADSLSTEPPRCMSARTHTHTHAERERRRERERERHGYRLLSVSWRPTRERQRKRETWLSSAICKLETQEKLWYDSFGVWEPRESIQ